MDRDRLDADAVAGFAPDAKVGLLATRDPRGLPHVSLITSLSALDEQTLVWGQFTEGRSKQHVRDEPRTGFAVMTLDRKLWRGKADWLRAAGDGPEYVQFNRRPMFRYNAYTGVYAVHYMRVAAASGRLGLPLAGMLAGAPLAAAGRVLAGRSRSAVFNPWTLRHLASLTTLKFLCWIDEDDYPLIVPLVPCLPAGSDRLVFSPTVFTADFARLKPGTTVAVFALNLQTESVLLRGPFRGFRGVGPMRVGTVEVRWVYNTMPPVSGQIYPPEALGVPGPLPFG